MFREIRDLYCNRSMMVICFLGIFSAFPFTIINSGINTWLAVAGIDKSTIGFFSILSLPYSTKFIVAPFIDSIRAPWLWRFGKRVSWMLVLSVGAALSIVLMAILGPADNLLLFAISAFAVAFFSANCDTMVDAFRLESVPKENHGGAASVAVFGYRVGILIAGGFALMMIDYLCKDLGVCDGYVNWVIVFCCLAFLVPCGGLLVLWHKDHNIEQSVKVENSIREEEIVVWLYNIVVNPFKDFILKVDNWLIACSIMVFYRACDAFIAMMMGPFLLDMGFSIFEIGKAIKSFGFFASVIGGFAGGMLIKKIGVKHSMYLCGVLQMSSNLVFMVQASLGYDMVFLYFAVAVENISGGMASIAFVSFAMRLCSFGNYAASQYALMTSLAAMDKIVMGSLSGLIVEQFGWHSFFLISFFLGLPALFLVFLFYDYGKNKNPKENAV